jgi:hypothetical protein
VHRIIGCAACSSNVSGGRPEQLHEWGEAWLACRRIRGDGLDAQPTEIQRKGCANPTEGVEAFATLSKRDGEQGRINCLQLLEQVPWDRLVRAEARMMMDT